MMKIKKYLLRFFSNYNPEDSKIKLRIKHSIARYFEEDFDGNGFYSVSQLGITDIIIKIEDKVITIDITLERPGLLIGKAGRTIDGLTAYLERLHEKKIKIKIHESVLWTK